MMPWQRPLSPCVRCKGPKGETRQGARNCNSCSELREQEKEERKSQRIVRASDWLTWLGIRKQVVDMWLRGYSASQMGEEMTTIAHGNHKPGSLSESTVRGYFQRIYNEYGLTAGRRTPAAAVHEAIRRGDIPCPCPNHASPSTPDELVAQLEREIRAYRRRGQPAQPQPGQRPKAAPPAQPRVEESYLDRINRVREEGRRGVGVQPETYLDRINRIRRGSGKV